MGTSPKHRELSSVLCGDLDGWCGMEAQEGENVCVPIAECMDATLYHIDPSLCPNQ